MILRKTQTEAYWREQFQVTSADLGRFYDLILEQGRPVTAGSLARALIEDQYRQEEARSQAELSRGPVYQPKDSYQLGQQIVFPARDYAWATVVGTRPGHNPAFGDFTVIQVRFDGQDQVQEFASGLQGAHKLNRKEGEAGWAPDSSLTGPSELYERYGSAVEAQVNRFLGQHAEFVRFGDDWFLRELLVDVNAGQLNIAEALLEVKSMPLPTAELLHDLDLPAEVPEQLRLLSLAHALEADPRFVNVGDSGRDVWYLRQLIPAVVAMPPSRLVVRSEPYDRQNIAEDLLPVEREIDDEVLEESQAPARPIYRTTVILTYPHWRSGTLPLATRTMGLFPRPTHQQTPIILVDGQTGERMQGWVVLDTHVVYGLADWYLRHALPVGAYIKLERTRDPRVITVDFEPQRLRRVWVKVAVAEPNGLTFQMRKLPAACNLDEQIVLSVENPQTADELQATLDARGDSILDIMTAIMPELIKLSPQATVHAKTVYSAVNVLRRTAPGPIFALLSIQPGFVPMGGGYWTFDEARARL